jgi:hypothetical protein
MKRMTLFIIITAAITCIMVAAGYVWYSYQAARAVEAVIKGRPIRAATPEA